LNAVRIIHPTIIDTVLLYPHPRGLPIRYGLKYLAKSCLDKDIQMSGAQGHDSKEDAIAAGELVRLQVKERWRQMENEGWVVKDGEFIPPKAKER
jgi:RNA exonuclease 1